MVSLNRLLDVDLAGLGSLGLGNDDAENAILKAGLDGILVDAAWEAEAAVELADAALTDPELGVVIVLLRNIPLRLFGNLSVGGFGALILDSGLVVVFLLTLLLVVLSLLNETLRLLALLPHSLMATRDGEGVGVSPLDIDVLLLDTREFTVEFVGALGLRDVELGREALDIPVQLAGYLTLVVVQKTEQRREFLSESWEERHCCCGVVVSSDWSGSLRDAIKLELLWNSSDG
jgi:hypothetical protein